MSGIVGLYHLDGREAQLREDLTRMAKLLGHRGPTRIWIDGAVGLGNCRPNDSAGADLQEFCSADDSGHLFLSADTRIDNKQELRSRLGWREAEPSDRDLVLGAYSHWGERCGEYLLGDFAFAVWDTRNRRLFCLRDHFGLKPFYYVWLHPNFAFASEIKALLSLPWVAARPNETRVADYLMQMFEDKENTFYQGIIRLPPGHSLTVSADGARVRQYWRLEPGHEVRYSSDDEYAEAFRDIFVAAVRSRIPRDTPIGSFLSGGLDSSAVTCVARSLLSETDNGLDTFSVVFDKLPQSDERTYIDAVLEQEGLRPHFVRGDQVSLLDDLDKMLWHAEEPFITANLFLYWKLYQAAQQRGVGVVLDGLFGDHVVSHGTRYITELAATGRWIRLLQEVNAIGKLLGSRRLHTKRLLQEYVFDPLLFEPLQRLRRAATKPKLPPFAFSQFVNAEFAHRMDWMERARSFKRDGPRTSHSARAEHLADLTSGAIPSVLEIANKAASAFGVTPHFPFMDRRLAEYCLAIPVTQKYASGWTRVILRRALRDYLPVKIRERYGKKYWHHALEHSLFVLAKEDMDGFIFDRIDIASPFVSVQAVQSSYRQILSEQGLDSGYSAHDGILSIWSAVVLTRWLELEKERSITDGG